MLLGEASNNFSDPRQRPKEIRVPAHSIDEWHGSLKMSHCKFSRVTLTVDLHGVCPRSVIVLCNLESLFVSGFSHIIFKSAHTQAQLVPSPQCSFFSISSTCPLIIIPILLYFPDAQPHHSIGVKQDGKSNILGHTFIAASKATTS
jgi:hypothetical protein